MAELNTAVSAVGGLATTVANTGDIEIGVGAGVQMTYNLAEMSTAEKVVMGASWLVGGAAGALAGGTFGAALEGAMPLTGLLTGVHAGVDLGLLAGDIVASTAINAFNDPAVEVNGGVFGWAAARPIKVGIDGAKIRTRFQHNEEKSYKADPDF